MAIKGIAFDLEGTCIDLELLHFTSYSQALFDVGITMSAEDIWSLPGAIGGGSRFIALEIQKMYPAVDLSDFSQRKKKYFEEKMNEADIIPREGLKECIELLLSLSIPLTLGSRTTRSQGEYLLAKSGLNSYFNTTNTVFAEDVINNKPAPDVYLKTAEIMDISPKEQLVFEDSAVGIEAGVLAGSFVVAVPSPIGVTQTYITTLAEAGAKRVIRSWEEVTPEFVDTL